jgi:site-specific DNA recombinase
MVQAFTVDDEQYKWMVEGLKEINASKDREVADRTVAITKEIQRLNGRLSQLYEDKLDGLITKDFYQKKFEEGQSKIQDMEASLLSLNMANEKQMELGLTILEFAKDAYSVFKQMDATEQGKFLRIVFSKCDLKDGKLSPTYKKPFDVLVKNAKIKRDYPQGNSNPRRLREREVS